LPRPARSVHQKYILFDFTVLKTAIDLFTNWLRQPGAITTAMRLQKAMARDWNQLMGQQGIGSHPRGNAG
jgi:hypothetical protein